MQQQQVIVMKAEKNPGLGAALAFMFGPVGLLYSDVTAAAIMFIPYVISSLCIALIIGFVMLPICAVVSAFWAYKKCEAYNAALGNVVHMEATKKAA